MPEVALELEIKAPIARVWDVVLDISRYPDSMVNVCSVTILFGENTLDRTSAWSVKLKGSILEWTERETIDPDAHVVRFHQLSGDLARFDGSWEVDAVGENATMVRFTASFEIGIPLLADMLNPVAQRALRDNAIDMLTGIEREVAAI